MKITKRDVVFFAAIETILIAGFLLTIRWFGTAGGRDYIFMVMLLGFSAMATLASKARRARKENP